MTANEKRSPRVVNLSIDEIAEALESCTFDTRYILDLQDQEIIMLSEFLMSGEEIQDEFEKIDEDETGRYVLFPIRTDSRAGYEYMQLFIDNIKDHHIRSLADQAIRSSGTFRRFKNFIRTYPALEKEWYAWKDERTNIRAREWLKEEGIILMKLD